MNHTIHPRLFRRYRQSLVAAGLRTSRDDALICPLCWREKALDSLTVEHVVSQSLGGDAVALSCRRCNSTQGSVLEGALAKLNLYCGFLQGRNPLRFNLLINDRIAAATARRDPGLPAQRKTF